MIVKRLLGLLICLAMTAPAFASIAVSPTCLEINANKTKSNYITAAVDVRGDSKSIMRFKVYPEYFKIDETSNIVMIPASDEAHNISKKVRFVPSEFTIQPGKTQKLRINIANIKSLPDGESRAILYIEDVNPKEYNIPTGQAGIGAQLIVKTRVGIPVYVDKGKFTKIGEIEHFNVSQDKNQLIVDMKVLSKGNSKIRYNTKIQVAKGKKLIKEFRINEKVAAGGSFNPIKEKFDKKGIEPGEYTVRAVVLYTDENGKRKTVKKETVLNIQGEM